MQNRDYKQTIFGFWETLEHANLFQGTKSIGVPLGGPHLYRYIIYELLYRIQNVNMYALRDYVLRCLVLLNILVTVKAAPYEFVIRTGLP